MSLLVSELADKEGSPASPEIARALYCLVSSLGVGFHLKLDGKNAVRSESALNCCTALPRFLPSEGRSCSERG